MAAGAPRQRFFDNQFGSIYDVIIHTIAPRIQTARDQNDPNAPLMEDDAAELAEFFYGHMGHDPQHNPFPQSQFFPEFQDAYTIVIQMNNQVQAAQNQQDPQAQAMRNELRDRKDNLEIFMSEDFIRKFINRGIPLQGGRHKRKARKSRKAKRKTRKTKRR